MPDKRAHLSEDRLKELLQAKELNELELDELVRLFRGEASLQEHLPSGRYAVDPRFGSRVLFNPSRARRPHDQIPAATNQGEAAETCPICRGNTTGVVDRAQLSAGYTFINKNLYPMLYPFESDDDLARGLHFLQWTSSYHNRDWHNLPAADRPLVLGRLAALERKLISGRNPFAAGSDSGPYVSIIKNRGTIVGASLSHGHQQIAVSNVMPGWTAANARFEQAQGVPFSQFVLKSAPASLMIRDYGQAVLLVPPFMKRPYDMLLVNKDPSKAYLHQLDAAELAAIADGWHEATRAIHSVLGRMGREIAYNVLVSNGPGAGLYLEFLPYSQITGGYEHLGLYVCQSIPEMAAEDLRQALDEPMEQS
ncbi:MAG: hypothetical protein WBR18_11395 [Anaerolineales bacterium]